MPCSTTLSAFIVMLFAVSTGGQAVDSYKVVSTQYGAVRGHLAQDGDYYAFQGIPYAAPPTGQNRYKAPLPPTPWEEVYEANYSVMCPQVGTGNEDCLIINVFTPTTTGNISLPILVYIHGGAFFAGVGPTEGFSRLIEQDIIVVTFNYRIGALGFLCLGIDEAPGNAALKDQLAALSWVQRNIANFGGDPNQVTIHGTSAGAVSAHYQLLMQTNAGLFQRAIIESGAMASVWALDDDPIGTAYKVAALDSQEPNNLEELVQYYREVPADRLTLIALMYFQTIRNGGVGFAPCIERGLPGVDAFMNESTYDVLTAGNYDNIPIMLVYATLESLYIKSADYFQHQDRMETNFYEFLPGDIVFDTVDIRNEVADSAKFFYFGNRTVAEDAMAYLEYVSDYLIWHGVMDSVMIHSERGSTVYLMEFAYRGDMAPKDPYFYNLTVAGHGDLLFYLIVQSNVSNALDELIVNRVNKIVGNFIIHGNPTPSADQLLPVTWPTVEANTANYLLVTEDLQILRDPYWNRKLFWDNLYAQYRRQPAPVDPDLGSSAYRTVVSISCLLIVFLHAIWFLKA